MVSSRRPLYGLRASPTLEMPPEMQHMGSPQPRGSIILSHQPTQGLGTGDMLVEEGVP